MDLAALRSWASRPDVCRCCLAASGTWDLTASYINNGVKEVFSEMVVNCFGIKLSRLSEWGPGRLLCQLCAVRLRDANTFKNQVTEAEQCFVQFFVDRETSLEADPNITIKSENEADEVDVFSNGLPSVADAECIPDPDRCTPAKVEIKIEKVQRTKRKRQKNTKKYSKRLESRIDSADDNTPISELLSLTEEDKSSAFENKADVIADSITRDFGNINASPEESEKTKNPLLCLRQEGIKHKPGTKQVSERQRIILTCHTVLKYTSACPFRHHKSWFQCFYCLQDFMEINLLRHHNSQTHTSIEDELKKIKRFPRSLQIEITDLQCLKCSLNLASVDSMKEHFSQQHDEVIYKECIADYKVDRSPFKCHLCKLEFHVFRSLTVHLNDHYANCICDVCGKSFLNSKRLKVHKRTHESGIFPCSECGKVLKTKTSRANHVENSHSKRVLKCHICAKPMKHYNDRIKHMSETHQVTHTFKCPMCPKEYNIKHYLATHVRQTHGSKNKKCPECNMAFITNHGLKKHMLKHSGQKPFACHVCGKAYARRYTLREHMRAHPD